MKSPRDDVRGRLRLGRAARTIAGALATPLVPADFLDLIAPMRRGADLRGRVVAVEPATTSATTVTIRPGRGWRGHRPGQYTRIGIDIDGVRHWRAYSLTGPVNPQDGTITITVRAIKDGIVSNHALRSLRPGAMVLLDQAKGDFVLPEPAPPRVLFLTAGSGITPIIGMLRHTSGLRDVVVVHSAPTEAEMLFRDELRTMHARGRIRLVEHITDEHGAGRLAVREIGQIVPDWRERETWACGPTGLLDDAEAFWAEAGLADRLHTERFRSRIHVVGDGGRVMFVRSDIAVDADAATPLLDVGEAAGVLMPSGCRMGICFNCVVRLAEGSVRDLRTGEITEAADDPPLIQTCVSAAAGACHLSL